MRIQNFMRQLRDTDLINEEAVHHALDGNSLVEELTTEQLSKLPEIVYVRSQDGYLVGSVQRDFLLFLVQSQTAVIPLQILESIHDGIVAVNAMGRIFYANAAYTTVLGVPLRRVLGKYIQEIEPNSLLAQVLLERTARSSSKQMVPSVGKYVSLQAFPLWSGTDFLGAVSVFRDVTELYQLNREVRHMTGIVDEYSRRLQEHEVSRDLHLASRDRKFQKVIRQSAMAAQTNVSVLLNGELGVGKNVIALYMHRCSPQHEKPFLTVNCSAATEEFLDTELFGTEEHPGKLELARGGTLYLDEIGDLPLRTQARLQYALSQKLDCRLISSSSQELDGLVQEKKFRRDLFFRIAGITLNIPPLRERPDDIIQLANYFLDYYNNKHQKKLILSSVVYENLCAYNWPGNVRELKNHIERLVILGDDTQPLPVVIPIAAGMHTDEHIYSGTLSEQVQALEARAISAAIAQCAGNRSRAMERLGLSRRTFYRKCAEHGIGAK